MLAELLILAGLNQPVTAVNDAQAVPTAKSALVLHCLARQPLVAHLKEIGATPLFIGLTTIGLAMEVWREPSKHENDPWVDLSPAVTALPASSPMAKD